MIQILMNKVTFATENLKLLKQNTVSIVQNITLKPGP